MMSIDNFNFKMSLQVRWGDLDPLGHVNNAVFVTYFEIGRSLYMPAASSKWDWYKHMFLIGDIQVKFIEELKITDPKPEVWVRTSKLGTKSFVLEYAITTTAADSKPKVHAYGSTTQILFDTTSKKTIEIQDWLRKDLTTFDKV